MGANIYLSIRGIYLLGLINKFPLLKDRYLHPFLFNLDVRDKKKFQAIEKPVNMAASKHIGYAIQWFGLCAALIILTIYA